MKLLSTVVLLSVLPIATSFAAQGTQQGAGEEVQEAEPVPAAKTLKPGDPCHTNKDGVTVCNTGDGSAGEDGKITINPQSGSTSSATTVDFKNDAKGTVTGIDGNDTVNTANGSNATISGTGGAVNVGSGSTGNVTNTNPVGGGGASITVNIGGGSVTVPPGGTINFNG